MLRNHSRRQPLAHAARCGAAMMSSPSADDRPPSRRPRSGTRLGGASHQLSVRYHAYRLLSRMGSQSYLRSEPLAQIVSRVTDR